jgi:hypothetical protein
MTTFISVTEIISTVLSSVTATKWLFDAADVHNGVPEMEGVRLCG